MRGGADEGEDINFFDLVDDDNGSEQGTVYERCSYYMD